MSTIHFCCFTLDTLIDTPLGSRPIGELKLGDKVYTETADGLRLVVPVVRMRAAMDRQVVRVILEDGRQVVVTPEHPLYDGRAIGDLREGDEVDGSTVVSALALKDEKQTAAIQPDGETGIYWAGGIRVLPGIKELEALSEPVLQAV